MGLQTVQTLNKTMYFPWKVVTLDLLTVRGKFFLEWLVLHDDLHTGGARKNILKSTIPPPQNYFSYK